MIRFRTTLEDTILVAGDGVVVTSVFTLTVAGGSRYALKWRDQVLDLPASYGNDTHLSDAEWHGLGLNFDGNELTLTAYDANGTQQTQNRLLVTPGTGVPVFNTKFGGLNTAKRAFAVGTVSNFVGCMQDIRVNNQWVIPSEQTPYSVNIGLQCVRQPQCFPDTCSTHGRCVDLWVRQECLCVAPYLPPDCSLKFPEATFGYEGNRSFAEVQMTAQEQEQLELRTDLSMLVRTRASEGSLAFLGSQANVNPDLDTFIALEIYRGQLRANVKLGGRRVASFMGGPRLDDGLLHSVWVSRHENTVTGYVDEKAVFEGKLDHPFAHPLLATHFYIGGYPLPFPSPTPGAITKRRRRRQVDGGDPKKGPLAEITANLPTERVVTLNPEAFSSANSFKGTLQDVRVNDEHVALFPLETTRTQSGVEVDVPLFGRVELRNNVLKGTVSDDTCKTGPCQNNGACKVTFNDYECACVLGWRGKNCSEVDHCATSNVCRPESVCRNLETGGYICGGPATFDKSSESQFALLPAANTVRSSILFYTISFKIRSRDTSPGNLLYLTSPSNLQQFFAIQMQKGGLNLVYRLGTDPLVTETNVTGFVNVTDGLWHTVKLTMLTEQSYVNVDGNETALYLQGKPTVPPSDVFAAGPDGKLYVGAVPQAVNGGAASFKGCLDEVVLGAMPPLAFYDSTTYGAQVTVDHFIAESIQQVSGGCSGDPQCTIPTSGPGEIGPCLNGAVCNDLWNALRCDCLPGFQGRFCEINIDDCPNNECKSGRCVDGIQSYTCDCEPGYEGTFCEIDINECASNPCQNGATCTDFVNRFECQCTANYTGDICDLLITVDCASSPCLNGGQCGDVFIGPDRRRSFECSCPAGYRGRVCEYERDFCEGEPCTNGATCISQAAAASFLCQCMPGYTGTQCQTDINFCDSFPCNNGGTCADGLLTFNCTCSEGWTGLACEIDVDECLLGPCANGATCYNVPGNYTCECPQYYLGRNCELAGTCLTSPCVNGACNQLDAARHACQCTLGYTGASCDTEIDYCTPNPCFEGGACQRSIGDFTCLCPAGFTGKTCGTDIDDCASQPCGNGGLCEDGRNSYTCNCDGTGYEGPACDIDINECLASENCVRGDCLNHPGTYKCLCNQGYIGPRCFHTNPCLTPASNDSSVSSFATSRQGHKCRNRAVCQNPRVSLQKSGQEMVEYDCICSGDYEGQYCEVPRQAVDRGSSIPLAYILGPILGVVLLVLLVACIGFLVVARKQSATRGTYSPSRQEQTGGARMTYMMKPPPEERLI